MEKNNSAKRNPGFNLASGITVGTAIGVSTGDLALWIAPGIVFGLVRSERSG